MKKIIKKLVAAAICGTLVISMAAPCMAAAPTANVFVNFISAGQIVGKTIPAGSNVTAPAVPVCGGFTFCGFDRSLKNITSNTTITAVYVSNSLGEAAIAAKKASLPTPAISATTVADPNATSPVVVPAATAATTATTPATAATATTPATATSAVTLTAEQLAALAAYQAALAQNATAAQQITAPAATTPQITAPAATTPQITAPAATTPQITAPVATGLPSWVVGLEGVDAAGAANAYNYLKNTKGLDDASIQANWGAFMHHYAGHGVAGW